MARGGREGLFVGGTSARRPIFWWLRTKKKTSLLGLTWSNSFKKRLLAVASQYSVLSERSDVASLRVNSAAGGVLGLLDRTGNLFLP